MHKNIGYSATPAQHEEEEEKEYFNILSTDLPFASLSQNGRCFEPKIWQCS